MRSKVFFGVLFAWLLLACSVFTPEVSETQQTAPEPIMPQTYGYRVDINAVSGPNKGGQTIEAQIVGRKDLLEKIYLQYEYVDHDTTIYHICDVGTEFTIRCTTNYTVTQFSVLIVGVSGYDSDIVTFSNQNFDFSDFHTSEILIINLTFYWPEEIG